MSMYPIRTITALGGTDGGGGHRFDNIPQNFKHLRLIVSIRSQHNASTDFLFIRFNDDTGNNYAWRSMATSGSTITYTAYATAVTSYIALSGPGNIPAATSTANRFAGFVIDIFDYSNTSKATTVRGFGGFDNNASAAGMLGFSSGLYTQTNAITNIAVGSGTFYPVEGTRYELFGIRDAE